MYCQPPLQSWGTFSLEKKGLIFLQRSTGRFSRGVSALLGRGGRAGRRVKCSGDREAWSQGACGGFIRASLPPPCPACMCACARTRLAHVSGRSNPPTTPLGAWAVGLDQCIPAALESWLPRVNPSLLPLPLYPGQDEEGEKSPEKPGLPFPPSSSSAPWMAVAQRGAPGEGNPPFPSSFHFKPPSLGCSSGFCSFQEIVIHRACFFAKCNYQRPCVYGWGMVESNRKWLFFVLKAFFISGALGTSAAFSEWQRSVLLSPAR